MVIKQFLKPPNKQGWGETGKNPGRPAGVQSVKRAMTGTLSLIAVREGLGLGS